MKYLITGGHGNLGSKIRKHIVCASPTHAEMPVEDYPTVLEYFSRVKPDVCIHLAGFIDTKKCENEPSTAFEVNVLGTYNIFRACEIFGTKLIYISTDHVFGDDKGMYKETDKPTPHGVYAWTKYLSEVITLHNPNNMVIRTSFIAKLPPPDEIPGVFKDKYFSGKTVVEIAKDISEAIKMNLSGIWHIGGKRTTILEVAKKRWEELGIVSTGYGTISVEDNPFSRCGIPYLKDSSLDVSKWEEERKKH